MLGSRNASDAYEFVSDLAPRMRNRLYGHDQENERRYSAAQCIGAVRTVVTGRPPIPRRLAPATLSARTGTSACRCGAILRLSNGFNRKVDNHMAAVAINCFAYNFIEIHRTPRVSPAMAAGVTTRLYDVVDLVNLLIESEPAKVA
jgi:hypothetical protein